jgi:hypothetical protein
MGRCECCDNQYDKTFTVIDKDKVEHVFDSFECAIHVMAPQCAHCGTKIVGHGVEAGENIYCCANCSRAEVESQVAS